jgi:hypothetical protein
VSDEPDRATAGILKGLRIDLLIAICALLMSTLATGASWWQTHVLQQQLSAQVWPYVSISSSLTASGVSTISIRNDGLGPAILDSAVVLVDDKPQRNFVDVLHALLGPHLLRLAGKGKPHASLSVDFAGTGAGAVLRPGDDVTLLRLGNLQLAQRMMAAHTRMTIRTCYCAIVPGECWRSDSATTAPPQRTGSCPEIADDILHSDAAADIQRIVTDY